MAIIKCKMCGGNLIVTEGGAVGTCENCSCSMTIPSISDEQKANLFNRANHFRRQGEFDKALSAYEHIVAEDDTIAEAHWGIVLCRYGIEYVEDPDTHKLIPTCHRTSFDSILSDLDYQQALRHADPIAKGMYETEAVQIEQLQKDVLAISKQEEPYDIFISYKETTDGGSRTKDSVLAQVLYDQLTKEGFRAFFSRVSLEDKVGQQYEPYIFAALNSAKVMLVVGTDRDHFSAPWVRNEWSRYLAILKKQGGRLLIPCYRDMDAYDLPEELSVFQCQDMSKVGFEQDLLRGIRKVLSGAGSASTAQTAQASVPSVVSLLKRAELFLGDCDWESAKEYYNRALDISPECAEAYVGLLCSECSCTSKGELGRAYFTILEQTARSTIEDSGTGQSACRNLQLSWLKPMEALPNYEKAVRFGDALLQASLVEQAGIAKSNTDELLEALVSKENDAFCLVEKKQDFAADALKKAQHELASKEAAVKHQYEEEMHSASITSNVIGFGSVGLGVLFLFSGAVGTGILIGVIGWVVAFLVGETMMGGCRKRRSASDREVSELKSAVPKLESDLNLLNVETKRVQNRLEAAKGMLAVWAGEKSSRETPQR